MTNTRLPKGQSQLEVKATLRHHGKVNDCLSVTFDAEPTLEATERYVGWGAIILDKHSTRDRVMDTNAAGVWKTKYKAAERAMEKMREALINYTKATQTIGELCQPSVDDSTDVDHIMSNGDCRRVREAWEIAMATLETHPPDSDELSDENDQIHPR
jgi:hypothetical protein